LFAAYPRLTVEDVKACLAYAERVVMDKGQRLKRRTLRGNVPHPQV
jgi:uncharacterized protein (DUF433 family)